MQGPRELRAEREQEKEEGKKMRETVCEMSHGRCSAPTPLRPGRIDRRSGQTRLFALSDRTASFRQTTAIAPSASLLDLPDMR